MILDWLGTLPVIAAALAVAFLPGIASLLGLGLRGLPLLAFAPMMSVAFVSVAALVLGAVGVEWSLWSAVIVLVAFSAVAWGVGRRVRVPKAGAGSGRPKWVLIAALAVGIVVGVMRLSGYIDDPDGISQTNDAVFHLNAVRFILESGDASSMHVSRLTDATSFYPAGWHALVSLVVLLTGAEIPIAVNALSIVIGAVIWTLGVCWLTRLVSGSHLAAAYAAVLASSLQTFPLLMFQWGVLFPNALSTALLPAAVALVLSLPGWSRDDGILRASVRVVLTLGIVIGAIAFAQPAGLLPWAAVSLVWFTARMFGAAAPRLSFAARFVTVGVAWSALAVAWLWMSSSTSRSHWPPFRGRLEAIGDVLLNGQMRVPISVVVSVFAIIGVITAVITPGLRWLAVVWAGISAAYVVLSTSASPFVRDVIFGAWYADPNRIAALAPLVVIPLAGIGIDAIVRWAVGRFGPVAERGRVGILVPLAALSAAMVAIAVLTPAPMLDFPNDRFFSQSLYTVDDSTYLSVHERELLESLSDHVDDDERIIANPGTGSGFGYVLSGLDVFPRTWSPPTSASWDVLAQRLRDAGSDATVCAALHDYGDPEYVLDFGPGSTEPGRYVMPGMTAFEGQPGFERVTSEGEATLWRITACR